MATAGTASAGLSYPYNNSDVHIGYGGNHCEITEGICLEGETSGDLLTLSRIHNLEVEIINLKATCNQTSAGTITSTDQYGIKIASLENKVSALEKIMEVLQTNVIALLKTVISVLIK